MAKVFGFIVANKIFILFIANAFIGFMGAYSIYRSFLGTRLVSNPNERSSHSQPIPRGAGIGILLAFMLSGMVLRLPTTMIYAVIIVGVVSFYEDHFPTPIKFRLFVQFAAAILFLIPYVAAKTHNEWLGIIAIGLIIIFMVGTTNMFNFMDGINGIAGVTAVIGFGLLWYNAFIIEKNVSDEKGPIVTLTACIAIACLGFLPFNLPKARVFLGDVGSITLGFLFAGLTVYLSKSLIDILAYSGFIIPFYLDEALSVFRRIRKRQSLLIPHREHLYQLLANEMKIAHWKISVGYGLAQLIIGTAIIIMKSKGLVPIVMIWMVSFLGMAILYKVVTSARGSHHV